MLKQIRSYVRREGRMTPKQKRALQELWPIYGLNVQPQLLNLPAIFARDAETILEIGFGMGHSLFSMAQQSPQYNFIGIEVHKPGVGALLADMAEANLNNMRIFTEDALEVLRHCIADNSLMRLQLYFPDPWPKKRHHKRRIVQTDFIDLVASKLKTGGICHLVTDWQNYAEYMVEILENNQQLVNTSQQGYFSPRPDYRPITKYEQRAKRLGHDIYELLYRKIDTI